MALLKDLLTTDVGLMSAGVIAFMIFMGIYIGRFVSRKMREDATRSSDK